MAEERKIPTSLREKYTMERVRLYNLLWALEDGIKELASGNVASYSIGNRSCTYNDLDKLKTFYRETEERIEEIEAILRGASPRSVQVSTFLDPSICLFRR